MKTYMTSRTNAKKDILFSIGDWNEKVGSQEIPGVTGKFGLSLCPASFCIPRPNLVVTLVSLDFLLLHSCPLWWKKAKHWRIDAFELWCWRRLLRVPWTARRYNQSILKEISPEYSFKGLMLKLKLQYFGYLMWRTDSFRKTLMLG